MGADNPEIRALEGELAYRSRRTLGLDAAIAMDPPVSEAQRRAMWAAKEGHSTLGIPKSVGEKFVGKGHDANVSTGSQPGSDATIATPAAYHAERQAHHAEFMKKHQGASVTASMGDDLAKAAQAHSKAAAAHQGAMLAHGTARQHAEQTSPGYPGAKAEAMAAGMRADATTKAMLDQRQGSDGLQGWDAEGHDPATGQFTKEQHRAKSFEHADKSAQHRDLSKGRQGAHNSARRDHAMASSFHEKAANNPEAWANEAHKASAAAEKSSAQAHAQEPNGTKAIVTPQAKW